MSREGLDLTTLELIHAALRRDLSRLTGALRGPGVDRARAPALYRQWLTFAHQLHSHHTAEDRLVWPVLQGRANGAADEVLAAMHAEHETIDPMLETVGEQFARATAEPGHEAVSSLAASLDELAGRLEAHLQHEERDAIPLVERYLTPADLDIVSATQRREAGLRGARQFFPWVLEAAPTPARRQVLGKMPPPIRLLAHQWQRAHDREVARVFGTAGPASRV